MSTAVLNAKPRDVYQLFLDNDRVSEYNEHCNSLEDLQQLSKDTKVSWSVTNRMGPFKARDFVTVVHYRELQNGKLVAANRPAVHAKKPPVGKYQRAEVGGGRCILRERGHVL